MKSLSSMAGFALIAASLTLPASAAAGVTHEMTYRISLRKDGEGRFRDCQLHLVAAATRFEIWEFFVVAGRTTPAMVSAKVKLFDDKREKATPVRTLSVAVSVDGRKIALAEPDYLGDKTTLSYFAEPRDAQAIFRVLAQDTGALDLSIRGGQSDPSLVVRGKPVPFKGSAHPSECLAASQDTAAHRAAP